MGECMTRHDWYSSPYRFPRTTREAFQSYGNPVLTRRRSSSTAPFRRDWRELLRQILRGVIGYG